MATRNDPNAGFQEEIGGIDHGNLASSRNGGSLEDSVMKLTGLDARLPTSL